MRKFNIRYVVLQDTIGNNLKLWWHCLAHLHRSYRIQYFNDIDLISIGCADCHDSYWEHCAEEKFKEELAKEN